MMTRLIAMRIATVLPVLLVVATIVFVLLRPAPVTPHRCSPVKMPRLRLSPISGRSSAWIDPCRCNT